MEEVRSWLASATRKQSCAFDVWLLRQRKREVNPPITFFLQIALLPNKRLSRQDPVRDLSRDAFCLVTMAFLQGLLPNDLTLVPGILPPSRVNWELLVFGFQLFPVVSM